MMTAGRPSTPMAWTAIVLLLLAYALAILDRQIITLLVEPIKRDLSLSDTQFGLLVGLSFAMFYATLAIPLGWIADRTKRTRLLGLGIALWSLMTSMCGAARNFPQLFAARMLVGVGEATLVPTAWSLIPDYFERRKLGRAIAVYTFGLSFGVGGAFLIGGSIIAAAEALHARGWLPFPDARPWQTAFMLVGLPGLILALAFFLLPEPPRRERSSERAAPLSHSLAFIGKNRSLFVPFLLAIGLTNLVSHATSAWTAAFFIRVHGVEPATLGALLGTAIVIGGPLGLYLVGWLSDWLGARGRVDAPLIAALIGPALGLPFCAISLITSDTYIALASCVVWNICIMMPWGAGSSVVPLVTPNEYRGQVSSIYTFVMNVIGLGLGPLLPGMLSDGVFTAHDGVRWSLLTVLLIVLPLALMLILISRRPFRKAVADAQSWAGPRAPSAT